jgi:mannose-6-phosphate isomerase-like protein (cupin superfamily)|tara:strand:+ start:3394 stop:3753 length:360 start_codon:yes stop_codon:yes gene_type:complete
MQTIDVQNKLACVDEHWSPKVIAELNGQQVKVAKLLGEFDWHFHEQEDELFWVIQGCLEIHLRDKVVELHPGQLCVVPRGVEHKPVANSECQIVLFEPTGTLNTGNIVNARTVPSPEVI